MTVVTIGTAAVVAAVCAAAMTLSGGGDPPDSGGPNGTLGAAQASNVPFAPSPAAGSRAPTVDPRTAADTSPVRLVDGGGRRLAVTDDDSLAEALRAAAPGDVIQLATGTYRAFDIDRSGTAAAPITLQGRPGSVITGADSGYVVHLDGASHWQLTGFTVTGGAKGIVVDEGDHNVLDTLTVGRTGEEAVHFRKGSSDNVVQHSAVHDTGLTKPQYGEGVYIGSAKSNWTDGAPDLSMRNRVLDTTFTNIAAENVDIKEETAGTVLARNRFDGSGVQGENFADSVVDVKGYAATIVDNVTRGRSAALHNVIETHVITEPATSGCGNVFHNNTVEGFEPRGELVAVDAKCD